MWQGHLPTYTICKATSLHNLKPTPSAHHKFTNAENNVDKDSRLHILSANLQVYESWTWQYYKNQNIELRNNEHAEECSVDNGHSVHSEHITEHTNVNHKLHKSKLYYMNAIIWF